VQVKRQVLLFLGEAGDAITPEDVKQSHRGWIGDRLGEWA
jgi:hypothetical protein